MATLRIPKSTNGEKSLLPRRSTQWLLDAMGEMFNDNCTDAEILGVTRVQVMRGLATAGVPNDEIREIWQGQFALKSAQERYDLLSYFVYGE